MRFVSATDSSFVMTIIRRGAQHWLLFHLHESTNLFLQCFKDRLLLSASPIRGDCGQLASKISPFKHNAVICRQSRHKVSTACCEEFENLTRYASIDGPPAQREDCCVFRSAASCVFCVWVQSIRRTDGKQCLPHRVPPPRFRRRLEHS